ncbi:MULTISPECIES: DUF4209 domain-containing protein [unclassified Methanosarcina]|uniref:DUF4209 domain-containing protein n=1 Tax=unclassified Methanosarcina TaxID=2644672 RepID=UPI0025DB3C2C|nr:MULTISPECIES: DUF4209 domain-containing protein [unclassified Methanosarcina]
MEDIILDKSDFNKSNWQEVISSCDKKECLQYSTIFFNRAKEAESNGDSKNKTIFQILGLITSPILRESKEKPFVLEENFDNIKDLYLGILVDLTPDIFDAEMRARISDLLWIKKKDYKCALNAIDSYIESSKILEDPESWTSSFYRIRRAVDLAASLGKKSEKFETTIKYMEAILETYNGEDPKFLSIKIMELLQEYKKGDTEKYSLLSEKIALKAENYHDWWKAEHAWKTKAKWHRLAGEIDQEREALIRRVETYVKNAEDDVNKNPPDYINACGRIENAIQEYRKIGNEEKRIENLHKLLLEYQPKSTLQMFPIPLEISIPEEQIKKAKEFVRGKTLQDAIFTLSSITHPPEISKLKEDVEKTTIEYPMANLFYNKLVNEEGKQIGSGGSILSSNPHEREVATNNNMFKHAKIHHQFIYLGIIEPAKQQIIQDHDLITTQDLFPLVFNNPFVPVGREFIYASGLFAGLNGDFLTSIHLLIPQLENSIRYILTNNGIIVSGLDQNGTQNEYDLNITLKMKELNEIMPEDIVFDLRGLLIERYGSNLRNRMAHGLIDYNEYKFSLEIRYLWWLTLSLCYLWKVASRCSSEKEAEQ